MQYIPTSSFGRRTISAADLAARALAEIPLPRDRRSKWDILRDLVDARAAFALSDRALTVLGALLSFHRGTDLAEGGSVVFPSNATLSARAQGMAESTLRRHLAALVKAGLILRRDSPNGKRYARRGTTGELAVAYGFDLVPLLHRDAEIAAAARATREAEARRRTLRETLTLLWRDILAHVAWRRAEDLPVPTGTDDRTEDLRRLLRRKLPLYSLERLVHEARTLLKELRPATGTDETSGSDMRNERHLQESDKDTSESEEAEKPCETQRPRPLPLGLVLAACPEAATWSPDPLRNWSDLHRCAGTLGPMLGIPPDAWIAAQREMGPIPAAVTVLAILQRQERIRSPGAYLRRLTAKAAEGRFTPASMIHALAREAA